MITLKDHQQAMVELLASGSGIPSSASRLAHAMHDVLAYLNLEEAIHHAPLYGGDATTPGLNDKALAADIEACRPKDTMFDRARAAERRVKELENTVNQLRASSTELKAAKQAAEGKVYELEGKLKETEQLWRNSDRMRIEKTHLLSLEKATVRQLQEQLAEQAGCRKDDTQVPECNHEWVNMPGFWSGEDSPLNKPGYMLCRSCGATKQ